MYLKDVNVVSGTLLYPGGFAINIKSCIEVSRLSPATLQAFSCPAVDARCQLFRAPGSAGGQRLPVFANLQENTSSITCHFVHVQLGLCNCKSFKPRRSLKMYGLVALARLAN